MGGEPRHSAQAPPARISCIQTSQPTPGVVTVLTNRMTASAYDHISLFPLDVRQNLVRPKTRRDHSRQ